MELIRPGGVIFIGNLLWSWKAIDPGAQDEDTKVHMHCAGRFGGGWKQSCLCVAVTEACASSIVAAAAIQTIFVVTVCSPGNPCTE
jgi:hypothetical protein